MARFSNSYMRLSKSLRKANGPQPFLAKSLRAPKGELAEATERLEKAGALVPLVLRRKPAVTIIENYPTPQPDPLPEPFGGFSFRLPWAPSVNQAYCNNPKTGGRFKVKRAKLFFEQAILSMLEQNVPRGTITHHCAITITQHTYGDIGDCDNGIKHVLDVLKNHGVIKDDSRKIVKRVTIQDGSRVKKGNEYIEVRVDCIMSWSGL